MTTFGDDYFKFIIDSYEKDFVDTEVIIFSNDKNASPIRGVLVGWEECSQAGQMAPVVNTEHGKVIVFGTIVPLTDEIWNLVKVMTSYDGWVLFAGIKQMFEKCRRMNQSKNLRNAG
jgi:hypothetical protein